MKPAVGSFGILLAFLALSKPQTLPPCAVGVTTLVVSSNAEALDLSEALLCSGGQFEVAWVGNVRITSTIAVSNGTSLRITGSSFGAQGVVDGGGDTRCESLWFLIWVHCVVYVHPACSAKATVVQEGARFCLPSSLGFSALLLLTSRETEPATRALSRHPLRLTSLEPQGAMENHRKFQIFVQARGNFYGNFRGTARN